MLHSASGDAARPDALARCAELLWRAEADRTGIEPISDLQPTLTIDNAYAIQAINVDRRIAAGAVVKGHKVGLTSRVVQRHLGVLEPNAGVLVDEMLIDDGGVIDTGALIQPRVEAELAFVMGTDLAGPGVTDNDSRAAIAAVRPALEVNDSRIVDWRITLVDTVADNGSAARAVLGDGHLTASATDLRVLGVVINRNATMLHTGAGAAVLGDPVRAVTWLANNLAAAGRGLRKDDIVLSGALHRMIPVMPEDHIQAEFAHLGGVSVHFSAAAAVG